MRPKAPDGLTIPERAILARLRKGPAALSSLAHAARCKSASVKVYICRLRKKLPEGLSIPKSFYGHQTYHLETAKTKSLQATPARCKTETGATAANPGKKSRSGMQEKSNSNNMLYAPESLSEYTLCEPVWIARLFQQVSPRNILAFLKDSHKYIMIGLCPSPPVKGRHAGGVG